MHINPFQIAVIEDAVNGCEPEFGYTCIGDWYDTLQLPGESRCSA
jgi:hypothetical protein